MNTLTRTSAALLLATGSIAAQAPRTHDLKLVPANVHWGYYDAAVKPVLRVASGDTVRVEANGRARLARLRAAA